MKRIKKTNVILVRHAESFNNCLYDIIKEKFGIDVNDARYLEKEGELREADCGLSPRGHEQVFHLEEYFKKHSSKFFKDLGKVAIYCSPMRRCLLTCAGVSKGLNLPVTIVPNLYESTGCFKHLEDGSSVGISGSTSEQIEAEFPQYRCMPGMENGWYKLDRMETFEEFRDRGKLLVDWIWSLHDQELESQGAEDVVVVCHGNVMSAVMSGLMKGNSLIVHNNSAFSHLQLMTMENGEHVCVLKSMNNVCHLPQNSNLLCGNRVFGDYWIQEYLQYMG